MKNEEILKAIGQIDEKYIEEAMPSEENKAGKASGRKIRYWIAGIAACLVICIGIGSAFSGRGGSAKSTAAGSMSYDYAAQTEECAEAEMTLVAPAEAPMELKSDEMIAADNDYYGSNNAGAAKGSDVLSSTSQFSNVKLIYRAYLNLQTTEYEKTFEDISALVKLYGGYFENVDTSNGSYYSDYSYKSGYFAVRIPSDRYSDFLGAVGESCHIVNKNESVEDVGQQYFEIEARLETLRIKEERLQNLLKDATTMSDIIELESALSDTEYQIDMYSTDLKHYDSLINYSTVNISLEEVQRQTGSIEESNSFFARVARNFRYGLEACVDNIADFAYWVSYNLVGIVIVIAAIIIIRKYRLVSRLINYIRNRNN